MWFLNNKFTRKTTGKKIYLEILYKLSRKTIGKKIYLEFLYKLLAYIFKRTSA